jgi:hypothetical protein
MDQAHPQRPMETARRGRRVHLRAQAHAFCTTPMPSTKRLPRGHQLSQRALARQLRGHGHRFPNQQLRGIAAAIGLPPLPCATTNGR